MHEAVLSKSLIQFSVDGRGCVPSVLFDLRPNCGGGNEDNGDLFKRSHTHTATLSAPHSAGHRQPMPSPETPGHSQASLGQSLVGSLQYSCLENPMNSIKRQKDMTLKDELPRLVGAQYATGEEWRNNSKKNEGMEPKQKQYPAVDVTGDRSKV